MRTPAEIQAELDSVNAQIKKIVDLGVAETTSPTGEATRFQELKGLRELRKELFQELATANRFSGGTEDVHLARYGRCD